jgi:hypothetical protein
MSGGMSMFQSELRSAVRDARETPATQAAQPAGGSSGQPARARVELRPRSRPGKRVVIRLWLPLTPLWVILAPFALLLAPLVMLAPRLIPNRPGARAVRAAMAVRPYQTAFAFGAALMALSGTLVDVDTPDALVRIRIF